MGEANHSRTVASVPRPPAPKHKAPPLPTPLEREPQPLPVGEGSEYPCCLLEDGAQNKRHRRRRISITAGEESEANVTCGFTAR